ncbi:hypothetical protein [Paractinoplanes rishiriensis]|uniref:Uncharacterized protein n=1 Tax=Paractinoplanes rishiriensis TaxID=1050105 RepID=A0A919JWZ1_9ACTN|nr:hypothetical protein [Actinoplanes rishiriensis]GIE95144.1 hypothetical protein Ari01nite_26090 [Actinoplanes rishiriensis]
MTKFLAAGWSAAYATIALGWTITGRGFPFGPDDPGRDGSPLRNLDPGIGAPLFAAVLAITTVVLLVMAGRELPRGPARTALLTWMWLVIAALLLVVPDIRLLMITGYVPILIVGFPFGYPPVDYSEILTWVLGNQAFAVAGGLLLCRTVLRWQFRTAGACADCGRPALSGPVRWGPAVTYVAAVIPLLYAVSRVGWALGIPVGVTPEFLDELRRTGLVWAGLGLGLFAIAGSILTLGLVQRWGEVFPRWMVGLAGRRVPIRLATIPATLVAVFVGSASVALAADPESWRTILTPDGLASAPWVTWPAWSVALGAATLAYYLRRRPACEMCGVGDPPAGVVPVTQAGAY